MAKTKYKYGWKILACTTQGCDKLESYRSAIRTYSFGSKRYYPYRITRPEPDCGPLALFRTLPDLFRFRSNNWGMRNPHVARCRYKPWRGERDLWASCDYRGGDLPTGTVLAAEIIINKPKPVKHFLNGYEVDWRGNYRRLRNVKI